MRVSGGGILAGTGKVIGQVLIGLGGKCVPGGSDGTLTVQGDYTQSAGSELSLKVSGPAASTQYDVLNVTGTVTLAGQLTLNFINGFAPKANQVFNLITVGSNVVGQFDLVQINGLAPGFQYHLQQNGPGTFGLVAQNDGVVTSTTSGPLLSIGRAGTNLVITWPTNSAGFTLQSTPRLVPLAWTNVTSNPNPFTLIPSGPSQFFRLLSQ